MTDSEYVQMQLNTAQQSSENSRWGILLSALALALIIGLSAANIQEKRYGPATQNGVEQDLVHQLDGRGKWGGYLR